MINFNIQRFAPSGNEPLTIIWDDNNNEHSLRPLSTDITVENYTFSQEQNNQMLFLDKNTSVISDKDFSFKGKTNYTCIPGMKQTIQNNDNLSGETIYFDFPYCYNNMDKQFHLRLNESSKILKEELLEWLGESSSPAGDVKKDFIVGTTDTLKVYWDHIAQFGISFEGSSASAFNSWVYSIETMNESYYPDGGFSGNLIGTVTSIDTSCPLYNLFFHEGRAGFYDDGNDTEFPDYGSTGMWIYTFIEKEFIAPFGYTIDSSDENVIANILGMKIGSHNILEVKKGNSLVKTFHDWREPKLGDNLNGQTIKIIYPSNEPIYNTGYETSFLSNNYIVTDGNYMIREAGTYNQVDSASDYSWTIEDYIYSIEIYKLTSEGWIGDTVDTIYKSTTRIKTTYSGSGATSEIQSQTEDIRKTETTLPSDIGVFVSAVSNRGITFQVDDLRISTKTYSLQSLQGTDNLQNKMIFVSDFPTNIDKVWFPSPPSIDEYGRFDIPEQYTLLSAEKDFGNNGYYVYIISADMVPTYSDTGQASTPYYFVINGQNMGLSSTICSKQYGASEVGIWNAPIVPDQAPSSFTLAEAGLNTSSPLYPYIKKLVWDE